MNNDNPYVLFFGHAGGSQFNGKDSRPLITGLNPHEGGHSLYTSPWRSASYGDKEMLPFKYSLMDGRMQPDLNSANIPWNQHRIKEAPQGHCNLWHLEGWTVIAFWDRSGDDRGKSNSAFAIGKICDFLEAKVWAQVRYPALFKRFEAAGFELIHVGTKTFDRVVTNAGS